MAATASTTVREERWRAAGFDLRLERHGPDVASARLVVLHGGGGNATLLAPLARMAADAGFAAVAPDLPGFGWTRVPRKRALRYRDWLAVAAAVVEREAQRGPTVVFGLSMGGLLALDTAARTRAPKEVLATCLLEPRSPAVRRAMTGNAALAAAIPALGLARGVVDRVPVPMRLVSPMHEIANDPEVARQIARDPHAGGTWMPGRWLREFLEHEPVVAPESFDVCPVTVVHPADDRWTTVEATRPFLERITRVETRLVMLDRCGHLPLEEPGMSVLRDELVAALGHAAA